LSLAYLTMTLVRSYKDSWDTDKMQDNIVPMPYGKLLPSLIGSYNYNREDTLDWLVQLCPNCSSDNVCCLDPKFNPDIESAGRWFCISCQDSWRYEIEH